VSLFRAKTVQQRPLLPSEASRDKGVHECLHGLNVE